MGENCMEMEASGLGLWNDIDCSGFAGRCNAVGHTACNHRPSAEPKRYVCGYSINRTRFLLKRLRTVASGQSRTWIILLRRKRQQDQHLSFPSSMLWEERRWKGGEEEKEGIKTRAEIYDIIVSEEKVQTKLVTSLMF